MYESFYGLTDRPFALTPNPRFVYRSQQFKDAEAQLAYGVRSREGLMLLTGDSGSGKTTLCRALVETLSRSQAQCALIATPLHDGADLLAALLGEFGVSVPANASRRELLDRLSQFLRAQLALGRTCVAIFDEAHLQPPEFFEQLRVLTNLETDEEKLIQVILAGQPVLLDTIRTPQMAQLDQRVSVRCALRDLGEAETGAYVNHRLDVAGADGRIRFAPRALADLYRASHGVPRLVNLIGDRALLAGFAANARDIGPDHVAKAVAALRGAEGGATSAVTAPKPRRTRRGRIAAIGTIGVVMVTAVASAGVMMWPRTPHKSAQTPDDASFARALAAQTPAEADAALQAFVAAFPASPHRDDALLRLAEVEQSRGDLAGAIVHLNAVAQHQASGPIRTRAVVLASNAMLVTGDSAAACTRIAGDSTLAVTGDSALASQLESLSSTCAARGALTPATPASDSGKAAPDTVAARVPLTGARPMAAPPSARPTATSAAPATTGPAAKSTAVPATMGAPLLRTTPTSTAAGPAAGTGVKSSTQKPPAEKPPAEKPLKDSIETKRVQTPATNEAAAAAATHKHVVPAAHKLSAPTHRPGSIAAAPARTLPPLPRMPAASTLLPTTTPVVATPTITPSTSTPSSTTPPGTTPPGTTLANPPSSRTT